MNILNIENKGIYFYLALEEYLIKNTEEDYFFLWSSNNSIVCGKHQNIYEEINMPYANENNIRIARRLSGGGAVFQDSGNINFTFILNKEEGKQINFKKHITPIYNYLRNLNLNVEYSSRNDLFIDNKKISGNAEHVYKNRVLHHGTLLFSSDLDILEKSLKPKGYYKSKAIKSVRKSVSNISNYLENINIDIFKADLYSYIMKSFNVNNFKNIDNEVIILVNKLVEDKYKTIDWIYNYSPSFNFEGKIKTKLNNISFSLYIEKGIIIKCNFVNYYSINELFLNKSYNLDSIASIIEINNLDTLLQIEKQKLLYCFF